MCSTVRGGRPGPAADSAALDRLGSAIDELAAAAADPQGPATAERLARVWAMLAELDPELGRRVAGYEGQPPGGRTAGSPGGTLPAGGSG